MPGIPVILDTDIGDDIDDSWALAFMLNCPELDPRLIVTDSGDTLYRARIVARLLEIAGRTDIPIGVGTPCHSDRPDRLTEWLRDYELSSYRGVVHQDGVAAIIETVLSSPQTVTLICIGPVPNIGEAIRREPRILKNARFVGMHGSIRFGHGGSTPPIRECNVRHHTSDCQAALAADWDITITPLDSCGLVRLKGELYHAVLGSVDPLVRAVVESYRLWLECNGEPEVFDLQSSILFDTVAVYLAFSTDHLVMEDLPVSVTDDGFTVIDPDAKPISVATGWENLEAFEHLLVSRLTGESHASDT